ncbi:MAG TPA: hypothetical protein VLX92_33325, partial [Kofleriaceae bacterium]|nr:hypothetical protein [Kofleriaceae bacterium]
LAAGLAALAIAVTTWASAIAPRHKPDPRVVMRGELAQVVQARKLRIEILNIEIAGRCLTAPSEELVRLLVLDGRSADARHFADAYIWHCGGDDVIARWGAAPKPGL